MTIAVTKIIMSNFVKYAQSIIAVAITMNSSY